MNILVVDDEDLVAGMASVAFKRLGHDVEIALSGESALKIIIAKGNSKPFDLVLTDLNMGGMDGLELIRQAKVLSQTSNTVFWLWSSNAHENEDLLVFAWSIGITRVIVKPIGYTGLKELLTEDFGDSPESST